MNIANLRVRVGAKDVPAAGDEPEMPAAARKPQITHVFSDIREMLNRCSQCSRNDKLIITIKALILAGYDTGSQIVGAAMGLGFARGHAGAVLSKSEGSNPARHEWQRGADGRYRVHEAEELAAVA